MKVQRLGVIDRALEYEETIKDFKRKETAQKGSLLAVDLIACPLLPLQNDFVVTRQSLLPLSASSLAIELPTFAAHNSMQ